jgi:hypothetical protein
MYIQEVQLEEEDLPKPEVLAVQYLVNSVKQDQMVALMKLLSAVGPMMGMGLPPKPGVMLPLPAPPSTSSPAPVTTQNVIPANLKDTKQEVVFSIEMVQSMIDKSMESIEKRLMAHIDEKFSQLQVSLDKLGR